MVGLVATSSKRAYAIPKSAAPRALPLQQSTADLYLHWRHSDTDTHPMSKVGEAPARQ